MDTVITLLTKLKGVHIGLFMVGAIAIFYLFTNVEQNKLEHLKTGGVLACGVEGKTEVIDERYRVSSPKGIYILSQTGKKWKLSDCTPFAASPIVGRLEK